MAPGKFVGGAQLDLLPAFTSSFVLLIVLALSFQRVLGLDEKLLRAFQRHRARQQAAEKARLEQARKTFEAQYHREE